MSCIAFCGGGKMASAIISGLISSGNRPSGKGLPEIFVAEPDERAREMLARSFPGVVIVSGCAELPDDGIFVIAVKPQIVEEVFAAIVHRKFSGILSIAAGVSCARIEDRLASAGGGGIPVVRAMPNTPAMIRSAITAIAPGRHATALLVDQAREIFSAIGDVVVVEEHELDAVTAISGSGPAYFFLLIRELEKSAISLGLSPDLSRKLVLATARGAGLLAAASESSVDDLIAGVASKGGTTERALEAFMEHRFDRIVKAAVGAAYDRSRELGR